MIETEEGIILSTTGDVRDEKKTETYLLTVEDIQDLMREAYTRRGKKL